jgi:phosphopantothenoylcysteine decarboxylase/phosphopantothenate--cysteine ligase
MGIALALECANNGAKVDLVLGPTNLDCKHTNVTTHRVESANEMYDTVNNNFKTSDISIFTAAVSDYAPEIVASNKIKKSEEKILIPLVKTTDILSEMTAHKTENQFVVGFSLETENELKNAKEKLERKDLDMIVLNSLNNEGAGFQCDTNKITIIDRENNIIDFELKSKSEVAKDIVSKIIELS